MKTDVRLLQYADEFILEWDMFGKKSVEKISKLVLCLITFFSRKSCRLWDNEEKW